MAASNPSEASATGHTFRAGSDTVPLDTERLGAWIAGVGLSLDRDQPIRQFASGLANINYLIHAGGLPLVLRRPPSELMGR